MGKDHRNYSTDKWRQTDRYDHIITEDTARAGGNFLRPRAYTSITGLLGCAVVIAVLWGLTALFGDGFITLLTWLVWALIVFSPIWMAQGIIRFLLPPNRRPPVIPTWIIAVVTLASVIVWDLAYGLPTNA